MFFRTKTVAVWKHADEPIEKERLAFNIFLIEIWPLASSWKVGRLTHTIAHTNILALNYLQKTNKNLIQ